MSKEPKITLVGAGPGDTDLMTLKGIKALYPLFKSRRKTHDVVIGK